MEAKSTDSKTFQLIENGLFLGELVYENLFFLNAEIILPNTEQYKIEPIGVFQTYLSVTKNGLAFAKLKMNWSGQIVFSFIDGREFVFKSKGFIHKNFSIENKEQEKIIQFNPIFNWRKSNFNYEISCNKNLQDTLLVLLGIYASNYYISCMSGANTGMA
jgi:hypothetical protein